ncbi:endo-1,4-beta-xylanase [Roseimarinus sediminis]|uniref:endo-1,4-beta-xylanase n=1 Tax=Roseimarinus sediminis TaxID=1610899 RepID=UPI003D200560
MRLVKKIFLFLSVLFVSGSIFLWPLKVKAQSYQTWYNNAQQRIDTLRKGMYGIKIIDDNGEPYTGEVAVRLAKHEFPFGAAFDFYEGGASMGNTYSTNSNIQADADAEIYKTERWSDYLAYSLPVERGKEYKLTLKFAEIYHGSNKARIFDVKVDGEMFLDNFDTHALAGGKNIAIDTSLSLTSGTNAISIELTASLDNVALKGIVLEELNSDQIIRINCGGQALITSNGNEYVSEAGFFDPDVNTVASSEQWMKAVMYKYFNAGVSGNSFKWSGIQSRHTSPNYTDFENAVRWTQKVGWDLRAHTLLWGGDDDHSMPGWVRSLPTPQAITDTCKMRVIREVSRYKGIIKEYDVINEPLTGHADHLRKTVGDSILWNCFKWARSADPDAELYVNDYNVEFNWGQAEEYRDLILKMKEMGAPVTGVGMQAHFWDCCRPGINELVSNINIVAEAGLPIKLTEYDYGGNLSQAEQAADYIKVLTIAFSHPSIVGIMHWGINDKGAWRENTGFFDANNQPKLAADTLLYYTKTKWTTQFDSVMSPVDPMVFTAYHGHYTIEVEMDGVSKVFNVPLLKENADSIFTLHEADALLKGPQLINAEHNGTDQVRLLFDKAIDGNSLKRSDFKFFSGRSIGLEAVQLESTNDKALLLTLSTTVNEDEYTSVAYFPGNLKAADGSSADAFGPESVLPEKTNVSAANLSANGIRVYPNPATDRLTVDCEGGAFEIEMYNTLGAKVYGGMSPGNQLHVNLAELKRGIYMIRLTREDKQQFIRKVVLK